MAPLSQSTCSMELEWWFPGGSRKIYYFSSLWLQTCLKKRYSKLFVVCLLHFTKINFVTTKSFEKKKNSDYNLIIKIKKILNYIETEIKEWHVGLVNEWHMYVHVFVWTDLWTNCMVLGTCQHLSICWLSGASLSLYKQTGWFKHVNWYAWGWS